MTGGSPPGKRTILARVAPAAQVADSSEMIARAAYWNVIATLRGQPSPLPARAGDDDGDDDEIRVHGFGARRVARYTTLVILAKIAALVALLALAPWAWHFQTSQGVYQLLPHTTYGTGPIALVIVNVLAILGLFVAPFLVSRPLRILLVCLFLSGFALDQPFLKVAGVHLDMHMMELLWREAPMAGEAISAYSEQILETTILVALLGIALAVYPGVGLRSRWTLIPIVGFLGVSIHLFSYDRALSSYHTVKYMEEPARSGPSANH